MSPGYEINLPPGRYTAKELVGDFTARLKEDWKRVFGVPYDERLCSPEFAIMLAKQCLSAKWNPDIEGEKVKIRTYALLADLGLFPSVIPAEAGIQAYTAYSGFPFSGE